MSLEPSWRYVPVVRLLSPVLPVVCVPRPRWLATSDTMKAKGYEGEGLLGEGSPGGDAET